MARNILAGSMESWQLCCITTISKGVVGFLLSVPINSFHNRGGCWNFVAYSLEVSQLAPEVHDAWKANCSALGAKLFRGELLKRGGIILSSWWFVSTHLKNMIVKFDHFAR